MPRVQTLFCSIVAFVVLAATIIRPAGAAPVLSGPPVEINAIASLTGTGAFIGSQEWQALQAYESVVNATGGIHGHPVHFVMGDDQSNPAVAVQLANAVIAKGAIVILGPGLAATCRALTPLIKDGPVSYCFSPAIEPPPGAYAFTAGPSTAQNMAASLAYLNGRGAKRIALIVSTDATGLHGEELLQQAIHQPEFAGMNLVADEHFGVTDVSVAAQVARIKAANPQAIISWTSGTPTATVLRALHDTGLDVPVVTGAGNIVRQQLLGYATFVPSELLFTGMRFMASSLVRPGPVRDAQALFSNGLKAKGVVGEVSHDIAWTPATIVVDALRHLPENPTAAQLKDYIEKMHGFAVPDSLMDFRDGSQRGVPRAAVVIVRWIPSKAAFVPVSQPGGTPLSTH